MTRRPAPRPPRLRRLLIAAGVVVCAAILVTVAVTQRKTPVQTPSPDTAKAAPASSSAPDGVNEELRIWTLEDKAADKEADRRAAKLRADTPEHLQGTGVPNSPALKDQKNASAIPSSALPDFSSGTPAKNGKAARTPIRIGIFTYAPPWYDGAFMDETLQYLEWLLPQFEFTVSYLSGDEMKKALESRTIDLAAAPKTFFLMSPVAGLQELAGIVSDTASDPSRSAAAAVIVRRDDTRFRSIDDIAGHTVEVTAGEPSPGLYEVQYELVKRGVNPERALQLKYAPQLSMRKVIEDVAAGRADAGILRACSVEDLWRAGSQNYEKEVRILESKDHLKDGLTCLHSTAVYPGWTVAASDRLPQEAARVITATLLSKPANAWGQYWSVSTANGEALEMLRGLKTGPYSYLGDWPIKRIWENYWGVIVVSILALLMLAFYSLILKKLVRRRTREFERVQAKQQASERSARELTEKFDALQRAGAVGQISSIVAHEMKQPLAVIQNLSRGSLRMLEDDPDAIQDPDAITNAIESINEEAGRAAKIIDRVRSYSQGVTEREHLAFEPTVRKIVDQFRASGKGRLAEIHFEGSAEGSVFMNPFDLELIVINLLSNAVDAASKSENPLVLAEVSREADKVKFTVTDNGPALTDDAFAALGGSVLKTTKKNGLGLGLMIVKTISENYVGRLAFRRGTPSGTAAEVTLPVDTARINEKEHAS